MGVCVLLVILSDLESHFFRYHYPHSKREGIGKSQWVACKLVFSLRTLSSKSILLVS